MSENRVIVDLITKATEEMSDEVFVLFTKNLIDHAVCLVDHIKPFSTEDHVICSIMRGMKNVTDDDQKKADVEKMIFLRTLESAVGGEAGDFRKALFSSIFCLIYSKARTRFGAP